ncbi:MAG: RidA family protein [Acidobacteriota bacterium]|nr:RidA family protein [Acidobacteriota bacterium]
MRNVTRSSPVAGAKAPAAGGRVFAVLVFAVLVFAALALAAAPAGRASEEAAPASPEARLAALGLELPELPAPVANYVRAVRTGNLVFLAGHGPAKREGGYVTGKLGADLDVEQGYAAARATGLALLASLRAEIGSLDRVRRIVKVLGMVNSAPEFTDQHKVMNGFSDLMVEVFGERGKHARSAVGMVSLPIGLAVEIEMIVEVEPRDAP